MVFLIAKVHYLAGRIFARKLKAHDLNEINPAQGRILFALWQEDGVPIQKLAQRTALGKSTLTSMLDRLEEAGFVRREADAEDRRVIRIWRTEKDRSFQAAYLEVSQEMQDLFYAGFSRAEIEHFEEMLLRLLDNLTDAGVEV